MQHVLHVRHAALPTRPTADIGARPPPATTSAAYDPPREIPFIFAGVLPGGAGLDGVGVTDRLLLRMAPARIGEMSGLYGLVGSAVLGPVVYGQTVAALLPNPIAHTAVDAVVPLPPEPASIPPGGVAR
jgi:hypothetical protein